MASPSVGSQVSTGTWLVTIVEARPWRSSRISRRSRRSPAFEPQTPDTRHYDAASTGLGKSWIACALGHEACRDNRSVLYQRVPRLFEALALARGDGRYGRLLKTLGRVQLLILDDWGLSVLCSSM